MIVETEGPVSKPTRPRVAAVWMLFACLLFSVMSLCVKKASEEVGFVEAATGRAFFGAVTIWLYARARDIPLEVHDRKLQWSRTIAGTLSMFFGFYALSKLPLGDAVTLSNLTPLFIAVASYRVLGERTGGGLALAVLLGLAGVGLLAGAHFAYHGGGVRPFFGLGAGVIAAFFSCVAMLFLRQLSSRESAEGVSLHFLLVASIVLFVVGLPMARVPSAHAFAFLVSAGILGGIAQVAMTKAYGLDKAARVGALGYSGVVIAQVLGVLFLHEIPSGRQLVGAALVIASGAFVLLARSTR
ncbi:MAG: DMT family transporter [Polyangiales bacterium]